MKNSHLTISTLGKIFSRQYFDFFFLIFPRKQDLTFHGTCGRGIETNCTKCQILFSGKNKKNIRL